MNLLLLHIDVCLCDWLTVSGHAHCQTFLQPAVLAAVSAGAVNQTVLLARTGVGGVTLLAASEETLRYKTSETPRSHLQSTFSLLHSSSTILYSEPAASTMSHFHFDILTGLVLFLCWWFTSLFASGDSSLKLLMAMTWMDVLKYFKLKW